MSPMSPSDEHFAQGRRFGVSDSAWRAIQFEHGGGMSSSVDALPFVDRPRFNMVIGAVIRVNAVVIGDETDHLEQDAEFKDRVFPWYVLENFFCVVWIFEMFSRMHYHPPWNCRHGYFTDPWNVLDYHLVVL